MATSSDFKNDEGVGSHSRDAHRPRLASYLPSLRSEGTGKTGCLLHPRSRVRFAQTKLHTSIQGSAKHSGLPCAMALRFTLLLPGERLFCLRRLLFLIARLTPAPRRPNHTTSPYASGAYVYRALSVHRISPRVRDDRERPSSAVRRAEL